MNNENLESSLDDLSESNKLELFKVEELELRLETAAISPRGGTSTVKPAAPPSPYPINYFCGFPPDPMHDRLCW